MDWLLAVFLRPFVMLVLFAGIVAPIAYVIRRVMPQSRLKATLFDRTLFTRRKIVPVGLVLGFYVIFFVSIGLYFRA